MRLPHLLLAALLLTLTTACHRDSRLQGKWTFDRPYSESQLAKQPPAPTLGKDASLVDALKPMADALAPMLFAQLEGVTLTITSKDLRWTTKDGNGQVNNYEVIERPDRDTWRVKTSEGKIETYARQGDHLVATPTGGASFKLYFKPAGN